MTYLSNPMVSAKALSGGAGQGARRGARRETPLCARARPERSRFLSSGCRDRATGPTVRVLTSVSKRVDTALQSQNQCVRLPATHLKAVQLMIKDPSFAVGKVPD